MTSEAASEDVQASERRVLLQVLVLNVLLVVGLGVAGVIGDSSALIANALDNASDSAVYAISFFAVGRGARWKQGAARVSGVLLILFALGVLFDAYRRFVTGAEPLGPMMMGMGVASAVVNLVCVRLLKRITTNDVNIRAATTFSANDAVSSIGILVAGALVAWTGRLWPDLAVGVAVALVAVWGAVEILRDARHAD
jgi:cation diffusion facilitator family transporter